MDPRLPYAPVRRWDAVTRTMDRRRLGPITIPMAVAIAILAVGLAITIAAARGRDLPIVVAIAVIGAVVTGVAAAAANAFARPPAVRRAFEAFIYLGEWELDRVSALAGRNLGANVEAMRRHFTSAEERPEDRWIRVEMLATSGDLIAAREMAERMPEDTPYDRVERTAAIVFLDWLQGGRGDPAPIREAVTEVVPADGDERRRAEVVLGLAEVRHRLGLGVDPADALEPLERARSRIGPAADDALVRMTRRAAPSFVQTAGSFVFLLLVLDYVGVF